MINPDTSKPNQNTIYIATSGGGKSVALRQNEHLLSKEKKRVIFWDCNNDHKAAVRFNKISDFVRFLKENGKKDSFSVAYSGVQKPEIFELFCFAVWMILDGTKKTVIVCEELAGACGGVGKAPHNVSIMMNQCRKYGGIFLGTTQKSQEISKTLFDQCAIKYIGIQRTASQIRRMAEEIGINKKEIEALKPLEFFVDTGYGKPVKRKMKLVVNN